MAYSDFTLGKAVRKFGLTLDENTSLFDSVQAVLISASFKYLMDEYIPLALAIGTEKVRSELMIAPVLVELRRMSNHQISFFSGVDFNVALMDGLSGFCDFIISQAQTQLILNSPLVMLAETKKENVLRGFGQCAAEMVAAQIFNERNDRSIEAIYGVVTTGTNWRFLKLTGQQLIIDPVEYYLENMGKLLGILLHIVGSAKPQDEGII